MHKKLLQLLLITVVCSSMAGCGKARTESTSSTSPESSFDSSVITPDVAPEDSLTPEPAETEETKITKEPEAAEKPGLTEEPGLAEDPQETEKPGVKEAELSPAQQYSDANRAVKFLGLKEYNKIEGDSYTDKPAKGNKFLVLFLSIWNRTPDEDYINYNYISASIDKKKTEHTFLVNEPKGYPTVFTHIKPDQEIAGFIVWEVPAGWKKLKFTYNGWEGPDNLLVKAEFTPEDLSDPVIYNSDDYN